MPAGVMLQLTNVLAFPSTVTLAVNCCVRFTATRGLAGVTVTERTLGGTNPPPPSPPHPTNRRVKGHRSNPYGRFIKLLDLPRSEQQLHRPGLRDQRARKNYHLAFEDAMVPQKGCAVGSVGGRRSPQLGKIGVGSPTVPVTTAFIPAKTRPKLSFATSPPQSSPRSGGGRMRGIILRVSWERVLALVSENWKDPRRFHPGAPHFFSVFVVAWGDAGGE